MATWTNKTKSSTTFTNKALTGVAHWDDANAAWDAPLFSWDAVRTVWTNRTKAFVTSMVTTNPFFGWLFLFTQPSNTETGTTWTNKTKH
jgi:hypothetical protein